MLENQGNSIIFYAFYTEDGALDTGLTVTVDVAEVLRDGTATKIVDDGACTEVLSLGLYRYILVAGSVDAAAEYVAIFHTADADTDQKDIPAVWVIDRAGTEKLDDGVTLAADAVSAAALKADAVAEIQSGLATPTNITAGTITTATNVTNLPTMPADWMTASGLKADAVAEIQSGLATPATVWTNSTRTLTQSAADVIDAVTGTAITKTRGNSWDFEITGVTLDANKQQLIIKRSRDDPDSAALLMIDSDDGLIILNGSTDVTAADASLSYAGTTLTPTVEASITAQLPDGTFVYNIQYVTAAAVVKEPYGGTFVITADGVRATE